MKEPYTEVLILLSTLFLFAILIAIVVLPFAIGKKAGLKYGMLASLLWLPLPFSFRYWLVGSIGCGHGHGCGNTTDIEILLILFVPPLLILIVLIVWYNNAYKKT